MSVHGTHNGSEPAIGSRRGRTNCPFRSSMSVNRLRANERVEVRTQYRVIVGMGVAVLALGAVTFPAGAGTPAISATPNTNLVHGQSITIEGTGFVPNSPFVEAVQCISGATTPSECDYTTAQSSSTDGSGNFSLTLQVKVLISVSAGAVDCRTPGACIVGGGTDFDDAATTPIEFDPNGPTPPGQPSEVTVTPNTDLVDGQQLQVSGTGFEPNSPALVVQCGIDFNPAFCDGESVVMLQTDSDGTFATAFTVQANFQEKLRFFDCRQIQCYVFAGAGGVRGVPISFRLVAPASVGVQPTFTG